MIDFNKQISNYSKVLESYTRELLNVRPLVGQDSEEMELLYKDGTRITLTKFIQLFIIRYGLGED